MAEQQVIEIVRIPSETERIVIDRFVADFERAERELKRVLAHFFPDPTTEYNTAARAWIRKPNGAP